MLLNYKSENILKKILENKKDFDLIAIDIVFIQNYFKNEKNKENILNTGFSGDLYQKILENKQNLLNLINIPYQKLFLSTNEDNMVPLGFTVFNYLNKSIHYLSIDVKEYPDLLLRHVPMHHQSLDIKDVVLLFLIKKDAVINKKFEYCKRLSTVDVDVFFKRKEFSYSEKYKFGNKSLSIYSKNLDEDFINNQVLHNKNVDLVINDLNDFNFLNNNDEKIEIIKRIVKEEISCKKTILIKLLESDKQLFKDFMSNNSLLAYKLFKLCTKDVEFTENKVKMKEYFDLLDEQYQDKIVEEYPYLNKNKIAFSKLNNDLKENNTVDCIINLDVLLKSTAIPKAIKDDLEANVKVIIEGTAQGYGYQLTTYMKNSKKCAISLKKEDRSVEILTREMFLQYFLKSLDLLYEKNEKLEKNNLIERLDSLIQKERMISEINVADKLQSRNNIRKF